MSVENLAGKFNNFHLYLRFPQITLTLILHISTLEGHFEITISLNTRAIWKVTSIYFW
jgi:hypothetical protein